MKEEITEKIRCSVFSESQFVGMSLGSAADYFSNLNDELLKKGYYNIIIKQDYDSMYLEATRLENDKEYNARIKKENDKRKKDDAKERAEYERLRKKYEDNN